MADVFSGTPGTQTITADGVIGTSGKPIRLFDVDCVATSGGAAVIKLYDGTSTGGTLQIQIDVSGASKTASYVSNKGVLFPNGLYVDLDDNTASVTCSFWKEN